MAIRSNHYEAAFEGYIRSIPVPCVAVDEAKRALFGEKGVKNPDFLLYPKHGPNLVVEVKGKKGKDSRGRRPWENWVTTDDLDGLARWQETVRAGVSGDPGLCLRGTFRPNLACRRGTARTSFRNLAYRFWAVGLDDYVAHLRSRGARPGRRSPWPELRFDAGSGRSTNWLPMTRPESPSVHKPVKER